MRDRKLNRLEGFDYSVEGYYFVTICTKNKIKWFGEIKNSEMVLNQYGKVVAECLRDLPNHYSNIQLDAFIIMPNHLHCIIIIKNDDVVVGNGLRPFLVVGNGPQSFPVVGNGFKPFLKKNQYSLSEVIRGLKTFSSCKINKKISGFTKSDGDNLISDKNITNLKRNGLKPFPTTTTSTTSGLIYDNNMCNDNSGNGLKPFPTFQWQKSFFDHIVRNEQSLNNIREYIINNPLKWELDIENRDVPGIITTKEYYGNIIGGKK